MEDDDVFSRTSMIHRTISLDLLAPRVVEYQVSVRVRGRQWLQPGIAASQRESDILWPLRHAQPRGVKEFLDMGVRRA